MKSVQFHYVKSGYSLCYNIVAFTLTRTSKALTSQIHLIRSVTDQASEIKEQMNYLLFFLANLRASSDFFFLFKDFFKKNSCFLQSFRIPAFLTWVLNLANKASVVSPSLSLTLQASLHHLLFCNKKCH